MAPGTETDTSGCSSLEVGPRHNSTALHNRGKLISNLRGKPREKAIGQKKEKERF